MKKLLIPFVALILFSHFANAIAIKKIDERKIVKPTPKIIASFYPFEFVASNMKVGLEWKLADAYTLKTNLRFGMADKSNFYSIGNNNITNYVGGMFEVQGRYYITHPAPKGLYVAAIAQYKQMSYDVNETTSIYNYLNNSYSYSNTLRNKNSSAFGFGFIGGGQAIISSKLALDLYIGTILMKGLNGSNAYNPSNFADKYNTGSTIVIGCNFGIGFGK